MQKDKTNIETGLPEISQAIMKKNAMKFILTGIVLVTFVGMYFHTKSQIKTEKPMEETYAFQSSPQEEHINVVEQPKTVAQPDPQPTQEQVAFIQEKQKELQQRLAAPLMVVNANVGDKLEAKSESPDRAVKKPFLNQLSALNTDSSNATNIGALNTLIAEGTFIHATLESATSSDLPGFLRANISEPVYSEDGSQILVPAGSRLIGQYKSGIAQGQSRIFIVWSRLITPNGISVKLESQGVDSLGVAGLGADEINRHFLERFGTASLLSLIGAGTSNIGVSGVDEQNSAAAYREAIASSFSQSASQSLQQDNNITPTLKTYQGKSIIVFVARDLHFADALKQTSPNINIF